MQQDGISEPEFSRAVEIDKLGSTPARFEIEAAAAECEALARRFGLESLDRLTAVVVLEPSGTNRVAVVGTVSATLTQTCVVTLAPVPRQVEESFSLLFAPAGAAGDEIVLSVDDDDWAEPLVDGRIDIGEAVVQQVALALDPFPRVAGAKLEQDQFGAVAEEAEANPFAVLARSKETP